MNRDQSAAPEKCPDCGGAYDDVLMIGVAESYGVTVPETHTTYVPHKDGCTHGLRPKSAAPETCPHGLEKEHTIYGEISGKPMQCCPSPVTAVDPEKEAGPPLTAYAVRALHDDSSIDLDAIETRLIAAEALGWKPPEPNLGTIVLTDVPALVAEVRRLRAALAASGEGFDAWRKSYLPVPAWSEGPTHPPERGAYLTPGEVEHMRAAWTAALLTSTGRELLERAQPLRDDVTVERLADEMRTNQNVPSQWRNLRPNNTEYWRSQARLAISMIMRGPL